jgi:hypothetical protein
MGGIKRKTLQIVLICGGAAMIALGIIFRELPVILSKAINICLKCIGIG